MDRFVNQEIGLLSLKIKDRDIEKDYQIDNSEQLIWQFRFAYITGIFFNIILVYADKIIDIEYSHFLLWMRAYVITAILLIAFLSTYTKRYIKYTQYINISLILIIGIIIIAIPSSGCSNNEMSRFYANIVVLLILMYAFIKIAYYKSFIIGILLSGGYIYTEYYFTDIPTNIVNYTAIVIIIINIIGVSISYIMEYQSKKGYLIRKTLSETAIKDTLTGLYNRHYFEQYCKSDIDQFILRSKSVNSIKRRLSDIKTAKYGLFMLDIDYFKRVNDTFGHYSGDLVLQQFAQLLKANVRRSDDVLRFGGEEFLLVLKLTSEEYLINFMKELGRLIEEYDFRIEGGGIIGCTASIGMVMIPSLRSDDVNELVKYADRALYKSKATGRNRGHRVYVLQGEMEYEEICWSGSN